MIDQGYSIDIKLFDASVLPVLVLTYQRSNKVSSSKKDSLATATTDSKRNPASIRNIGSKCNPLTKKDRIPKVGGSLSSRSTADANISGIDAFKILGQGERTVSLVDLDGVNSQNVDSISLINDPSRAQPELILRRDEGGNYLYWYANSNDWEELHRVVEQFLHSDPGSMEFAYLTTKRNGNVIVELRAK